MNVTQLQAWINDKIRSTGSDIKPLVVDGMGGPITRTTFISIFVNKNAKAITEEEVLAMAHKLGDSNADRLKAVAEVESSGFGWFNNGLPKILYERHYFYKAMGKTISWLGLGFLSKSNWGGYTVDANNNGINDSWDKLAMAVCINPLAALQSVSIGSFQVMGKWYRECGYSHPIDMLWDARQGEMGNYNMLVGFIQANNLTRAFLNISTDKQTNVPFVRAYNGKYWEKNDYANKLAVALMKVKGANNVTCS